MSEVHAKKLIEALLFTSPDPVAFQDIQRNLPADADVLALLEALQRDYQDRGIRLEQHDEFWAFRTAPELADDLTRVEMRHRPLSRAALETLAIIAYHQPVTRSEIEDIRGVSLSNSVMDALLETDWIAPGGRRETPGRPMLWVTTPGFLDHFDLTSLADMPRREELLAFDLFRPVRDDEDQTTD